MMGVPMIRMTSIFSPSVRSSRNSRTRKRRARTSTLLIAAATPRRIRTVTRMSLESKIYLQRANYGLPYRIVLAASRTACSAPAASGAPPCAMSRLPPPRVPSFCIASFMSAPMSFGSPGVWAKTSEGWAAAASYEDRDLALPNQSLRQHLDEVEIAVGKELRDELLSAACGMFLRCTQQVRGLQLGHFFQQLVLCLLPGLHVVE